jgi:hypothetical protein
LGFLIPGLVALTGRIPAASLRLVVFSLDQKKAMFRRVAFSLDGIDDVVKAIDAFQPGADRAADPIEFLAGLIGGELRAPGPPSTVIVFGGFSRVAGKFPEGILKAPPGVRFFYLQRRIRPLAPGLPRADPIDSAMAALRGKTLTVNHSDDLARAIAIVRKTAEIPVLQ